MRIRGPSAAINPLYSAMKKCGAVRDVLAQHVEGAFHMAQGRAQRRYPKADDKHRNCPWDPELA